MRKPGKIYFGKIHFGKILVLLSRILGSLIKVGYPSRFIQFLTALALVIISTASGALGVVPFSDIVSNPSNPIHPGDSFPAI